MLQNAYFLAKIGADTAENEQHFAESLPKTGNYPAHTHAVRPAAGERARCRELTEAKPTGENHGGRPRGRRSC